LESIIEQKYGVVGCRLFRILLDKKILEVKQLGELAMIPQNEARTLLYKLLQAGIVEIQEVPKFADHAPSKTFYLWRVNLEKVFGVIKEDMYKTVGNLRARLGFEQHQFFTDTGAGIDLKGAISDEQRKLILRLEQVEDRLEASIIHLMELIMFFEDC
jgi:DNA-directed RNA polymerase III subunit RPC3